MEKKHYNAIDGLKAIAAIGIVMMHMRANNAYSITGSIYNVVIPSFTNFVFLFMVLSAFGMCCGYYEKITSGNINLSTFYSKRFSKILPFFALLVMLDVILEPSKNALCEAFADITLMFGFLPNAGNISVIGVGWFIGLIFVFYISFPFFCSILDKKCKAWIVLGISLIYNYIGAEYFGITRKNILYCACFFLVGGISYIYREKIGKINQFIMLIVLIASVILYYMLGGSVYLSLLVSTAFLLFAMTYSGKILNNKVTKFISGISLEIYLSHMIIFRVLEKVGLNKKFGTGWIQYIIITVGVLIGAIIFSFIVKKLIDFGEEKILLKKDRK